MCVLHALSPAKRVGETGREMILADAKFIHLHRFAAEQRVLVGSE